MPNMLRLGTVVQVGIKEHALPGHAMATPIAGSLEGTRRLAAAAAHTAVVVVPLWP